MKKLISLIIIFVLLGVGIGAGWEFDNVKDFTPNDKYGTIEITNAFGLGDTLAEYTLLENTDVCFTDCKAIGTVTLYEPNLLFSELNFEDTKLNNKVIEHKIFIENSKVVYSNKDLFKESCNLEINGSNTCENVYVETQQVPRVIKYWEEYTYQELDIGVYNWKIEGKKGQLESIDWIASTLGTELREWAVWNKSTCDNRNSFNIMPIFTEANQQLELKLNYTTNTSKLYAILNASNKEMAWFRNNNTAVTSTIWVNTSVTAGTAFGIDVYYNCDDATPQYSCDNVFLECNDLDNKTQATVWGNNYYRADSSVTNSTSYIEGTGSNTLIHSDLNWQRDIIPRNLNVSYVWDIYDTGTTTASKFYALGMHVFNPANTKFFVGIDISATTTNYSVGNSEIALDTISNVTRITNQWIQAKVFRNASGEYGYINNRFIGFDSDNAGRAIVELNIVESFNAGYGIDFYRVISDRGGGGNPTITAMGEEDNAPDVLENVSIQPQVPTFGTELNCSVNYTAPIIATSYINFTWYKNDTNIATYNDQVNVAVIDKYYTAQPVNETLNVGDTWICSAFGTDGTTTKLLNSTAVTIQNTAPTTPTQQYPLNNTFNTTTSIEFKCNGSEHGDIHPTYYEFWGNFTEPLVILQNSTAETYTLNPWQNGTFTWACKSHDNISSSNFTTNFTLNIQTGNILSLQESHTATVPSGSSQTFKLNVTYNNLSIDNVTSIMYYNNTVRTVTTTTFNSTKTKFSTTFTVPLVPTKLNKTFYWNVTANYLNGSTKLFNYNYTQAINALTVYNCSANNASNLVLNLTLKNETTKLKIDTGTVQGYFTIWNTDQTVNTTSYIDLVGNETYLCISDNTSNFQANAEIHYRHANSYLRIHYLLNTTLNVSNKQTVDLHTLAEDDSNNIQFNLLDNLEKPIEFNYINVERFYPETNTYTLVAMGRSDDVGQDLIPLRMNDVYYKFTVKSYPNTIRLVSTPRKVTTTTLYFYISESSVPQILDSYNNVVYGLTYNNVTNTFRLEFTTDGTVQEMCMKVTKWRNIDSVQLCDQCLSSSSGTITCPTGNATGAYLATAYMNINPSPLLDSLEYVVWGVDNFFDKYGLKDSALLAFFLVAVLSMVMIFSPSAAIVMALLGLITSIMLGLFKIGMGTATVVVIAGIAILYKLRS